MDKNIGVRIGTVAKLVGVPVETIRTWERRYDLVSPIRGPRGIRLYRDTDVRRVSLVADLRRLGDSVSELATVSNDILQARLDQLNQDSQRSGGAAKLVALYGDSLNQLSGLQSGGLRPIEVSASATTLEALLQCEVIDSVDLLFTELERLGERPIESLAVLSERWRPAAVIVGYRFANRKTLRAIRAVNAHPLLLPLPAAQLREALVTRLALLQPPRSRQRDQRPTAPLFNDEQLSRLMEMTTPLKCECPNQLARLVSLLQGFEDYSRQCASQAPDDQELHTALAIGAGLARARMERLLVDVCENDGVDFYGEPLSPPTSQR